VADLMKQCWGADPTKRPTFSQILERKREDKTVFDFAVSEAVAGSASKDLNGKISEMWSNFGRGPDGLLSSVHWDVFSKGFGQLMRTDAGHPNMIALRALLNVDDNKKHVTWDNFHNFVQTFGPFEPAGGVKTGTLDEITKLIKEKWFWGDMSSEMAAKHLQGCKSGSFLVRFSATNLGVFTLSYRHSKENKVIHKRFDKSTVKWQNLAEEIKKEKKTLKLSRPAHSRPPKFVSILNPPGAGGYEPQLDGIEDDDWVDEPFKGTDTIT